MMSNNFTDFARVRMLWPDHLGLARGKYVPGRLAQRGSGFCVTSFAGSYDRDLIDAPGGYLLGGLRDMHGVPEQQTLRPSWEDERTGVAVAGLSIDEGPCQTSPRVGLQRIVADWEADGYQVKVGIELEGYLMQPSTESPGGWERYRNPRSMVYGTGSLGDPSGFVDRVMVMADNSGFRLESVNVEFDESQFEFTLEYDDALTAVDDAFLFRVMAREIAIGMGLDFTFLGKPFPAVSGSGVHVNFSLLDQDGRPVFADGHDPQGISALGRQCLGGLIDHHLGLTALLAPTVNAYRRLQPGSLAGCWANWGVDHRNVANRLPAEGGSAMRIENRIGDGSMNLHLGVAAVLAAARLGVADGSEPPARYEGDGFEDGGDAARSATSLGEALDHLEADQPLREAVGDHITANFMANKRREVERFDETGASIDSDELTSFEQAMYLPYH
ncbi:MAG: glutamine synthetase family protein [Actinomycetota bacterium]